MLHSIPLINIEPFHIGNALAKQSVAHQIGQACAEIGFFTITGHRISPQLLTDLQAAARAFFDLPLAAKNAVKQRTTGKGYMGVGTEHLAASLDKSSIQDYKESLNLGVPVDPESWPAQPAALQAICVNYIDAMCRLSLTLVELFALALNVPSAYFANKVDHPKMGLRLLNYPAIDQVTKGASRAGAHTDYGILTVLWSADSRGLQVQTRDGAWVDVLAPPDTFIINIGDLMMNWTNDKWVSTLHRVVAAADGPAPHRQSVAFFFSPNPDAVIECIPGCHSAENPPQYPPVLASKHHNLKKQKSLGGSANPG